jgi:malonyl CoA-acyl carrier protein transacylase
MKGVNFEAEKHVKYPAEEPKASRSIPSQSSYLERPAVPAFEDPAAISLLSRDCLKRFDYVCDILKDIQIGKNWDETPRFDTSLALLAAQDACARFKAWGDSIAAFHDGCVRTSLDSRLREAPDFRRRALQILEYMQEYLHEGE